MVSWSHQTAFALLADLVQSLACSVGKIVSQRTPLHPEMLCWLTLIFQEEAQGEPRVTVLDFCPQLVVTVGHSCPCSLLEDLLQP